MWRAPPVETSEGDMAMPNPKKHQYPTGVRESTCNLGESIRLARIRRRLTRTGLAKRMGVSAYTIRRIEGGSPGVAIGNVVLALVVLGLPTPDENRRPTRSDFGVLNVGAAEGENHDGSNIF